MPEDDPATAGRSAWIQHQESCSSPLAFKTQGDSLELRFEKHHQPGAGMLARGVLDFQYEADSSRHGPTSLASLPVHLDLVKAIALAAAIQRHVRAAGRQGWLDVQMVLAVVFLNRSAAMAWTTSSGWSATRVRRRSN